MTKYLEKWFEDWDWSVVENYQDELDTELRLEEETCRKLLEDVFEYAEKFFDRFDFSDQHQTVYVIPQDHEDGKKDIVPVLGYTGKVPGTNVPDKFKQVMKDLQKPHALRDQETIRTPWGKKYNKWDLAQDRINVRLKYLPGKSSFFISHTPLSLHSPSYPAMAVWEFNFSAKGWSSDTFSTYKSKATKLIEKSERLFFSTKGNRLRLYAFATAPDKNIFLKQSMFVGRGRVQIEENREYLNLDSEEGSEN